MCTRRKSPRTAVQPPRAPSAKNRRAEEIAELLSKKARLSPVYAGIRIPEKAAASSREWQAAFLMRELLSRFPDQIENVLSIRERLVGAWMGDGFRGSWYGCGLAEIVAWDAASIAEILNSAWPEGEARFTPAPLPIATAPESFASAVLDIAFPEGSSADGEAKILDALRAQHARFTIKREGDVYRLAVAEQTARKKIFFGGSYCRTPRGLSFIIEAGWKLDACRLFSGIPGVCINVRELNLD
jgi:hypothetical protein